MHKYIGMQKRKLTVFINAQNSTITSHPNPVLDQFIKGRVKNFEPSDESLFVLQIFEQTVLHYLRCLKQLNLKRNLIEKELYDSSRNKELKDLLSIEKSLVFFVFLGEKTSKFFL